MEVCKKKIDKALMTNRSSFRVGIQRAHLAILLLAPGFLTSVMAIATLWAPLVQIWSLYENGERF